LLEAVEEGLVADLDGHAAGEASICRAEHLAHTAFTEERLNLVGAETSAG
jgi:hypothetical protein